MRVAHINGCILCRNFRLATDLDDLIARAGAHSAANVGSARGPVPDETFYLAIENWRESDLFSERERLAMEYAERIAEAPASFRSMKSSGNDCTRHSTMRRSST